MLANALAPPGKMTWKHARHSRMFRWIRSQDLLRSAMENVARAEYGASEARDPTACSIFYTALRRKTLLVGLWRTAYGHPDRNNVLKFITNDFDDPRWRTAAQKNAYVLMSKQRFCGSMGISIATNMLTFRTCSLCHVVLPLGGSPARGGGHLPAESQGRRAGDRRGAGL